MAKGVSKNDYKASPEELANAQVAGSEYAKWKQNYSPLLKKRAVETQTDDIKTTLRGRANADTMQALSPAAGSMLGATSTSMAGDVAEALSGQLGEANVKAREYQNDMGADTLARARQQAGTAQQGLAEVSRLGTSAALAKAQAKQEVAQSKWNAAAQIGAAYVGQGMENLSETGKWHTPGILDGVDDNGKPIYKKATSIGDRWSVGTGRNFR